jgi:hypothetical protein
MQLGQLERSLLEDNLWSLYLVTPSLTANELPKLGGERRNPAWTTVDYQHERSLDTNRYYLLHRDRTPTIRRQVQ